MSTDYRTSRRVAYEREDRGVEQRQLFAIFFAAVVVAMVVFLLGVLAGKGRGPARGAGAPAEGGAEAVPLNAVAVQDAAPVEAQPSEPPAADEVAPTTAAAAVLDPSPAAAAVPDAPPPIQAPPKPRASIPSAAPTRAAAPAAKVAGAGYAVQVLASADPAKAKALVQRLKAKGYAAYVVSEGGDRLHRVRVGHYPGRDGAESLKARLIKAEGLASAWIVTPPGAR